MASAVPAFRSTKETTNYARLCRLLVDVGCHALRERFDKIHSPAGLFTLLQNPAVHGTLDSLRKKRVLNPSQWGKLYPAIRSSVTSVNFDITLLMVLLRSICGLTPPATGWDNLPPATDLSVEADIARVKFYRNRMYGHASHASVDDVTFSTCWNDITDAIVRLGGSLYRAAVNDLRNEPMDRDVEDHYKELLKQWKVDEDNIKIKLEEVGEKLEERKASVDNLEGRKAPVATVLVVNTIETIVQGGVVINVFNPPGSSQTTQRNDHTTELVYWNLILSLRRPLESFCQYLKNMLNVDVRHHDTGSLLLTVECRSLQILEGLWEDYCSGHLNEMAQESLITAEVLEKLGLSEIKLKIFISEEEYERGKQIFRETKEMKRTHSEAFGQESSMPSTSGKMKRTHPEAFGHESSMPSTSGSESQCINAMFLCEEWMSSKGDLPTFNREFAISLAKISNGEIKVHCYVSRSSESDREDARKNSVNLITATSIPGTSDPLDWLKIPLPELSHPDIVIGHGRKFGVPAYCIAKTTNCKWVQFVHVFCEDLGKFKQAVAENTDTIEENEKKHKSEIALCKAADAVVAVGTRLQLKYSRCLPDREVHVITPGIFEKFVSLAVKKAGQVTNDQEEFSIFVFGRGTFEDLSLKGYDVIADAVGSLGEKFKKTFVGSPEGQHRKIEEWLLQETRITRDQVTIRGYCDHEELKTMFLEADLVALPSRTEGFGLVALEAISAGVPVLVTSESGIAKALEKVEGGHLAVVKSGNREKWLQKITQLSMQNPEERCDGAVRLREEYCKVFSWKTQCAKFKEIVQGLTDRPTIAVGSNDSPTTAAGNTLKGLKEIPSVLNLMRRMITAPNLGADMTAEKDNNGKEGQPAENKDSTLLHSAAEGGDVSIIEIILSNGSEVNTKDSFGATPLMIAAAECKKQAVDFLLSKGADPSLTTNVGRNSLHAAAEGGDVSIVKAMLSHDIPLDSTDNDGITSLMIAVALNNFDTVEFLLSEGADPLLKTNEGRTALFFTALGGHTGVIERMLSFGLEIDSQDDEGVTTLMWAAACANLQAVRCLLEKGADPLLTANNGWSSLHFASKGANTATIETLLSYGIDVNVKTDSLIRMTPLMVAITNQNMEAVKGLLENGADPLVECSLIQYSSLFFALYLGNSESTVLFMIEAMLSSGLNINAQSSFGWTALMCAAFLKKREVFDFLLSKGADPSLKDKVGRTVLHHASEGGDITIIEKCLSCGLDIESKDNDGKTALDLAACSGSSDAFRFLRERRSIKNS